MITQNRHCTLIFLERTSPRPSGTNLKGCKGFVACEYGRPSSLPRAVVVVTQSCHRGGSDTEDGGQDIRYVASRTPDSYPVAFLYPRSLRGRSKKGRGREKSTKEGKGKVPSPLSPTPSLFPFFPIPYPFRRLLRRLYTPSDEWKGLSENAVHQGKK